MKKYMIRWNMVLCCFMSVISTIPVLAQKSAPQDSEVELQRAQALHEQAREATRGGNYEKALALAKQALKMREELLGTEQLDVANTLNLLGVLHYLRGEYEQAGPLYERALAIKQKALGKEHPEVADSMNNLSILYQKKGEYDKAEPLSRWALEIKERILGTDHPDVAVPLKTLADLHLLRGEYDEGEQRYRQALTIMEKALGTEHLDVAATLDSLATLYNERGEYELAESLLQRALAIREKTLGRDHPFIAYSLNSLALVHSAREEYNVAERLYRRALAIREKALGEEHAAVAVTLNSLANLHAKQGEYDEAERLYRRALAIEENARDEEYFGVASLLNNLALVLYARGEYDGAERLYQRALGIQENALGKEHPDIASSLHNLAILHSARRDIDTALRFHEQALLVREHVLRLELRSGSQDQKHSRLAKLDKTSASLSFHLDSAPDSPRAAVVAMNTILMHKGRVLDAMVDTLRAVRERLDEDSRARLDRLRRLQSELAYLFHQGPGTDEASRDRYARRRVALEREIDALDAELARQNPAYRALAKDVRVADVQAALPDSAALLELFAYRPFAFHAPGVKDVERFGEPRYAAYVVRGNGPVRGVDLGPVAPIDAAAQAFQESIAGHRADFQRHARTLDRLIMEPIRPILGDAQKLYIAPDGQLSMVSFAALMNEQGQYLIQQTSLSYLASGRDLVQTLPRQAPQSGPLIVADPSFDLPHSPMATTSIPALSTEDATLRSNSHVCQPLSPLPGTRAEADAVRALFDDATLFTQGKATESALSAVYGPLILHIATHGFFSPDQDVSSDTEAMDDFSMGAQPRVPVANGMLSSGFYLAGASLCRGSTEQSGAHDDGVVTALEASMLNLWGTKLVVLSACETGMGDVKVGQGIYGLRRAFAVAGAETLVMSLWRVSDPATAYLMRHYYQNLHRGHGRSEAMRAVQLDLIAQGGQRAHPFYWAPFIVSGDDSTLDGKAPPRLPAQARGGGCAGCASSDGGQGWPLGLIAALWLLARRIRRRAPGRAANGW